MLLATGSTVRACIHTSGQSNSERKSMPHRRGGEHEKRGKFKIFGMGGRLKKKGGFFVYRRLFTASWEQVVHT